MAYKKQNRQFGQIPLSPYKGTTGGKTEPKTIQWKGLNLRDTIDTGELSNAQNICSDALPYITPRPPRTTYRTGISHPQGMYATEAGLFWVAQNGSYDSLYFDNGTIVRVKNLCEHTTDKIRTMVDFNGVLIIFPDRKNYMYKDSPDQGVYDISDCPDINYATVYNNRIFGVGGNDIHATALGLYDDWISMSTPLVETDSWATDVASKGSFKGIAAYNNHVVMLKPEFMHQQYGAKPPFRLQDLYSIGTIDNRSVKEANNRLFFCDDKNVYLYTGGEPRPASLNLNKKFVEARAGSDNRKYYLSAYDGYSWNLFVYDTYSNIWMREDNLQVVDFAYWDKHLYALTSSGSILKFNSGTEDISWNFETDVKTFGEIGAKYVNEIRLRFELLPTSTLTVSIKYNNSSYETVKEYYGVTGTDLRAEECSIHPKEADRITIKYAGIGWAKIYQMQLSVIGGD